MAYSWSEYRVYMGGRFVTGIRGFRYKTARAIEAIYAEGDEVVDIGFGNRSYECEIKLLQNELEAIILSAPNRDPHSVKFTVVHSYLPLNGTGRIITDTCEDCYFTDIEKAMDQGATFMEITAPVFCKKIKYSTLLNPS